tara:strand:+ start:215 stop:367 length:153 start_codon:yes stop_codon:yes gene_type:complete
MSVLKFSIEKDDGEYHFHYEDGFNEGGGFRKTIDEALDVIKEIIEESEDV